MKKQMVTSRRARVLSIGAAVSAGILLLGGSIVAATSAEKAGEGHRETWQDKMSNVFRDTWKGFWTDKDAKSMSEASVSTASIDLREQPDSYTIRLNFPNRDLNRVDLQLAGETLRITAPAEGAAGEYRQDIALANADSTAAPKIERKPQDNLIVVTVPKVAGESLAHAPRRLTPFAQNLDAWDRDVLARMKEMQARMDSIFNEAFAEFDNDIGGIFDRSQFASSLDLQEEGNNYVVRAYLPDRDMKNLNVTADGQVLRIEAQSEENQQQQGRFSARKSEYAQVLTLPGKVEVTKMKVDRKDNMLIVTLPKAGTI